MTDQPLNVGVIGYGHFYRTNFIKKARQCPRLNLVGVYNRGEQRRRQAAEDGFRVTGDLDELLGWPEVEAVMIGTSNAAHREHAVAAARAGKHIFCEKPMALTAADAEAMTAEAAEAGVVTHVDHGGVYAAPFEAFAGAMRGHCGRVMQLWLRRSRRFGTWKMGARHGAVAHPEVSGGWTFHHSCHFLNEICVLMDTRTNPAVKVYHVRQKSCDEAPSEELTTTLIHFADGATASLCDGTTIGGFNDTGAIGSDADVRMQGDRITVVGHGPTNPEGRPGNLTRNVREIEVPSGGKGLDRVLGLFADAVRCGDDSGLMTFPRMVHEYHILEAMARSAETGEAVEVG